MQCCKCKKAIERYYGDFKGSPACIDCCRYWKIAGEAIDSWDDCDHNWCIWLTAAIQGQDASKAKAFMFVCSECGGTKTVKRGKDITSNNLS